MPKTWQCITTMKAKSNAEHFPTIYSLSEESEIQAAFLLFCVFLVAKRGLQTFGTLKDAKFTLLFSGLNITIIILCFLCSLLCFLSSISHAIINQSSTHLSSSDPEE